MDSCHGILTILPAPPLILYNPFFHSKGRGNFQNWLLEHDTTPHIFSSLPPPSYPEMERLDKQHPIVFFFSSSDENGAKKNGCLKYLLAQVVKNLPAMQETWVQFLVRKIPWRRKWQPTPVFLPGESYAQRSLVEPLVHGVTRVGHDLVTKPPPK